MPPDRMREINFSEREVEVAFKGEKLILDQRSIKLFGFVTRK